MARTATDTGRRPVSTRAADSWLSEELTFSAGTIRKRSLALILLRLPAFIPLLFILRGWLSLTAQHWIAPLRRWYGIMFAVIGFADTITASITGDFAGGVIGRVAGHSFLVVGLFIILVALPLLATANTPAQRKLGRYWKRLHRMTYVIWGLVVLHLLLLDGVMPFG